MTLGVWNAVPLSVFCIAACIMAEPFDHRVTPNCSPEEDVCYVELTVDRFDVMAWNDYEGEASAPVVEVNGILYKRNPLMNATCDDIIPLTLEDLATVQMGDGRYKMAYMVNNQTPGPTITVYQGQTLKVRVKNALPTEGISIHWHGMTQNNTNYMDGVAGITQCYINPRQTFTYKFLADPIGTHWYHSHTGNQRADGLYGALIVLPRPTTAMLTKPESPMPARWMSMLLSKWTTYNEPPSDPLRVSGREFVLLLSDWFSNEATDNMINYLQTVFKFDTGYDDLENCMIKETDTPSSDASTVRFESGLMNGRGRHPDAVTEVPYTRFVVKQNLHYKFRIVNTASMFGYRLSIDKHTMLVVSSDGQRIDPIQTHFLDVIAGERYDIIINAREDVSNYWIRAETVDPYVMRHQDNDTGQSLVAKGHMLGVLQYEGANISDPRSDQPKCTDEEPCVSVNCGSGDDTVSEGCIPIYDLHSRLTYDLEKTPGHLVEYFLNCQFLMTSHNVMRGVVNANHFELPAAPMVSHGNNNYDIRCDAVESDNGVYTCTYIIKVKLGSIVQLVMINDVAGSPGSVGSVSHPMHLHGNPFWVVKGGSTLAGDDGTPAPLVCEDDDCGHVTWTDPSWLGGNVPGMNLHDPVRKDTVAVGKDEYVVVRFQADNPGYWMLHCHVAIHHMDGMAVVIQVGDREDMPIPPTGFPSCEPFDID